MSDIQKSDPNTAATAGTNGAMRNGNGAGAEANAGTIRGTDIINEMQVAYLDYAMSVIVARALPDVRDGLKPVHRRILYAMWHDLGLTHDKPHKKSARIVGEVLGKYHPHGDTAVYDAMVRMAQPFSLRYPLVDGQGNFGSVDGDNAAAMRYTEARLASISDLMLEDLEKDTVDWHANFDNTLREPDIVPAALPNLLINGSSGIAVGMATNIPPHNLGEVVDAATWMIDHFDKLDDIHTNDLMQFIKGPDFPTGGIIYRLREESKNGGETEKVDVIHQGYSTGRARLIMQAKAHFEEMQRGRSRIVITELPYQTNKTTLIERIADLVRDGKIEGISDLRDESDRSGMRVCIELGRGIEPKTVLANLFKYTPLQQTFGMQLLALVDGQPRTLNLKRMLQHFIQHRQEIIRRRSEFDLTRARERLHIVEGLLKALDILDEVIATIRRSQTVDTARKNLIANFKFTELQAQAILELQLRRLAALERKKLQEEHDELKKRIAWLEDLLRSPHKVLELIKSDLLAIKEKYGDARRTQIVDLTKGAHTTHDLLPEQEVWVTVGTDGELRSANAGKLSQGVLRGAAKGSEAALLHANARDLLFLFTGTGRAAKLGVHEIPTNGSKSMTELTALAKRERVTAALSIPRPNGEEPSGYVFLATEQGVVKRVTLADLAASVSDGNVVINVEEKDRLGWALRSDGAREILLVTNSGQAIRFDEEDVRSMGLAAAGVGGIKLGKGERVIYAAVVEPEGFLLTATATGFAKLTPLAEFPKQGRNGGGVVAHKLAAARTGDVTAAALLPAANLPRLLVLLAAKSTPRIIETSAIPRQARAALGKLVVEGAAGAPPTAVRWLEGGDVVEAPAAAERRAPRLIEEVPAPPPTPATKAALPVKQAAAPAKAALPDAKPVPPSQAAKAAAPANVAPAKTSARFVPAKAPAAEIEKEAPDAAKSKREASPEKVVSPAEAIAPAKAVSAPKAKSPVEEELPPVDGVQATLFADPDLAPPKSKAGKLKTVTSVKKK